MSVAVGTQVAKARRGRRAIIALAIVWVSLLLLLPLAAIAWTVARAGLSSVAHTLTQPDVLHAFQLTAIITVITVLVTGVFGVIVAWVLVRQRFHGRSLLNAIVDIMYAYLDPRIRLQ